MKFVAATLCATAALFLTGCSDSDSSTTAAPAPTTTTTQATATSTTFLPTTRTALPTTRTALPTTRTALPTTSRPTSSGPNVATTTSGSGSTCSKSPSGKYCGTAMGMKGSATIDKSTFGLELAPLVDVSSVPYTMESCTTFLPDFSNPEMVALAKALGMGSDQLSKALKITYDQSNDTFEVDAMSAITLSLSRDQC